MPTVDTERFRLRNFVDKLVDSGECDVHDRPIDLIEVGGVLEGNPKAVQTQLPLTIVSKGRFDKSEPTKHNGEDLDVPTFLRRGVSLN